MRLDAAGSPGTSPGSAGPDDDPEYPLQLIGLRELRSHNSWMHNARR